MHFYSLPQEVAVTPLEPVQFFVSLLMTEERKKERKRKTRAIVGIESSEYNEIWNMHPTINTHNGMEL